MPRETIAVVQQATDKRLQRAAGGTKRTNGMSSVKDLQWYRRRTIVDRPREETT